MVRVVLRWLDSPWAFELMPGLNELGRNPTNDFRLSDPSVSSFHAEILVGTDEIRVRDLGSTNGTFIDDRRIEEDVLKGDQILRLGQVRLQLEQVPVTPAVSAAASLPETNAATELSPVCAYHREAGATYRCENCGGTFCDDCITVLGEDRLGATTICPLCHGQCYRLAMSQSKEARPSFLARLTQTLKIPFVR